MPTDSEKVLIGSIVQLTHTPPSLSEVLTHHRDKVKVKSIINYDALIARATALESTLASRTERVAALTDALRKYGYHTKDCAVFKAHRASCTCGFAANANSQKVGSTRCLREQGRPSRNPSASPPRSRAVSKRNDPGFVRWLKAQGPSALSWMTVQQMERAFIAGRESVKRRARKGAKR